MGDPCTTDTECPAASAIWASSVAVRCVSFSKESASNARLNTCGVCASQRFVLSTVSSMHSRSSARLSVLTTGVAKIAAPV